MGKTISSKAIGFGITQLSARQRQLDPGSADDFSEFAEYLSASEDRASRLFGSHERLIASLKTRLAEIRSQYDSSEAGALALHEALNAEHSEAWFILQALRRVNLIEKYIDDRPWEAVTLGIEFGELVAELGLKMDWEKHALVGQKQHDAQVQGARNRRMQSPQMRTELVNEAVANGMSRRAAMRQVADELGVSYSTIRKDLYPSKKVVPPLVE